MRACDTYYCVHVCVCARVCARTGLDNMAKQTHKKRHNTSYRPPIGHTQKCWWQSGTNPCMATNRCIDPPPTPLSFSPSLTHTHTKPTNQRGTYWHALTDELSKWFYKEIKRILIYAISLWSPRPSLQPALPPPSPRLSFPHGPRKKKCAHKTDIKTKKKASRRIKHFLYNTSSDNIFCHIVYFIVTRFFHDDIVSSCKILGSKFHLSTVTSS